MVLAAPPATDGFGATGDRQLVLGVSPAEEEALGKTLAAAEESGLTIVGRRLRSGRVRCVLMVASGASWEPAAFGRLTERRDVVVLKRCVDVDDLLATAAAGQAQVAVVAAEAPGLDAAAVELLRRHQVRLVAVRGRRRRGAAAARLPCRRDAGCCRPTTSTRWSRR